MPDSIKLQHFRNLVSLSSADGKIEESERASLSRIAAAIGIPADRLDVMLTHAHEYVYLVPQNTANREEQLQQMIDLALVDGQFALSERKLIKAVAHKLGFTHYEAENIIENYIAGK